MSNNEPIRLTQEGLKSLQDELEQLRNVERPDISARIKEAKEGGDISESGEYADAKQRQAFIEGRIRELESLLSKAEAIHPASQPAGTVGLGSVVTVEENGRRDTYRVVSAAEAGRGKNGEVRISDKSAVGAALLGRKVGDVVRVSVPAGEITLRVVGVE